MVENFCTSFGEATKNLVSESDVPQGAELVKIFKNVIETGLNNNGIKFEFVTGPWNGRDGLIYVMLKLDEPSGSFTRVYSIIIRRNTIDTFRMTGYNTLKVDKTFDIIKKYDEINPNLVEKLMLKLI